MTGSTEHLQAISRKSASAAPFIQGYQDSTRECGALKVLVVEDEFMIAWALQSQLEELGHDVETVSSGHEAVAAASTRLPDLVFMDINLGVGIDGIEAAERIQAGSPIPIIFVTAYSDDATRARAMTRVPVSILLSKPVTIRQIEVAISEIASGLK